jgi:hypothetical protein
MSSIRWRDCASAPVTADAMHVNETAAIISGRAERDQRWALMFLPFCEHGLESGR